MASISELLAQGAAELRTFQSTASAAPFDAAWLSRISNRLTAASALDPAKLEREVQAIARAFVDSGPMDEQAAPSFWLVVDALQRKAGANLKLTPRRFHQPALFIVEVLPDHLRSLDREIMFS